MRVGIEDKDRDIDIIIRILNSVRGEITLNDLLVKLLMKNLTSSDLLFLILQKLERKKVLLGSRGVVKMLTPVNEKIASKVKQEIIYELRKNRMLFVTPLEVGKYYQCPRRLFLEKVVLSRQHKERRGRVWDGEVVHLAVNLMIKRFTEPIKKVVEDSASIALSRYRGKTQLNKKTLVDFLMNLYDFLVEEKFTKIFTEKTFESFKHGLIGTPDIVGLKKNWELFPMDIKLGKVPTREIKEEHLLQCTGETILVEDFFRKPINNSYLIYFQSNSLVRIMIDNEMKRKFLGFKKEIERMCRSGRIPPMSSLFNFRRRVCLGCHVREVCQNIEELKKVGY